MFPTMNEVEESIDRKNPFGDAFPETVFGEIPECVMKFLVEAGFDRLITLTMLTDEDIVAIENESRSKLKLGHKRLIIQMVEYAKSSVKSNMATATESEKKTKKNSTLSKSSALKTAKPNSDGDDGDRNQNSKEMLHQSLKKTIRKFCDSYKMQSFDITNLDFVKSTDGAILYANVTCICGDDVKIYTNSSAKNLKSIAWVTSSMLRHLTKFHTPGVNKITKITEFLATSKPGNPEIENEIGDNVIDITDASTGAEIVKPISSPLHESISGECTGNMSS